MRDPEERPRLTGFLSGAVFWLMLTAVLAGLPPARGEDVAQPPSAEDTPPRAGVLQEPAPLGGKPLSPGVTGERQGRLLVLTYGSKSAGGAATATANAQDEPPGFVVYRGQRLIASGQFEYG